MYNLLIIDDESNKENRKSIYEFMFHGAFEMTCIDSEEDNIINKLNENYYDCVILDNNLNSGLEKEAVINLVSQYKCPIIMVSNDREFTEKEYMKKGIIDFISLSQYFELRKMQAKGEENEQRFINQILKDLHERIIYDIHAARKYASTRKNKVVICHISDIQFCDPKIDNNAIRTLFNRLEEFFINRNTPIDIVVISGDIVFSGKKKEFDIAKEAIKSFQEKLRRQRKNVEILLVPGNHDFNYQCYWAYEDEKCHIDEDKIEIIYEEFKSKHTDSEWSGKQIVNKMLEYCVTPDFFKVFEADSLASSNFRDFAFTLTGESQYLNTNFYVSNDKFQKSGFKFIGINNAYKYRKNISGGKRYFYELNSEVVYKVNEPLYSISVGHVDPRSLGYEIVCSEKEDRCNENTFRLECNVKGQCEKWGDMQRFFDNVNAIIYLFGHKHCADIELSNDKKVLFIGAASPTGISPSEKTINIVEISNGEDSIDVDIAVHRATSRKIAYIRTYKYQYDCKGNEWSDKK